MICLHLTFVINTYHVGNYKKRLDEHLAFPELLNEPLWFNPLILIYSAKINSKVRNLLVDSGITIVEDLFIEKRRETFFRTYIYIHEFMHHIRIKSLPKLQKIDQTIQLCWVKCEILLILWHIIIMTKDWVIFLDVMIKRLCISYINNVTLS